ncbi:membrane protein [Gordonia phage Culver]|nr:membrane protein [Gordonia phage Culver]
MSELDKAMIAYVIICVVLLISFMVFVTIATSSGR